jgi:hypothetical protein
MTGPARAFRSAGSADLPLHGGRVPRWLAERMSTLGRLIVEAIVLEYGRDELLRRLSDPFWFQSFGAVMGMDWHSSGITTSVMGALKRGLAPVSDDLGLWVCGGRGKHSRKTPAELLALGEQTGLDGELLARTSRLVAKVDSAAVQDGFALYLHSFVLAEDGQWTVVQQGMAPERKIARRYHWHSEKTGDDFLTEPHSAIENSAIENNAIDNPGLAARPQSIANLTDLAADASRSAQLELVASGPDRITRVALTLSEEAGRPQSLVLPHLDMPAHHAVLASDVRLRRLHASLAAAADRGPVDYADLLLQPGIGARTVLTLSMVAEVIYGAPYLFEDPGRYALALGGKDGHPFPVPLEVYDRTLQVLRQAVRRGRLGQREELEAMKRLDRQARRAEVWFEQADSSDQGSERPSYDQFVSEERRLSKQYGGRTVFDDGSKPKQIRSSSAQRTSGGATRRSSNRPGRSRTQLSLF